MCHIINCYPIVFSPFVLFLHLAFGYIQDFGLIRVVRFFSLSVEESGCSEQR